MTTPAEPVPYSDDDLPGLRESAALQGPTSVLARMLATYGALVKDLAAARRVVEAARLMRSLVKGNRSVQEAYFDSGIVEALQSMDDASLPAASGADEAWTDDCRNEEERAIVHGAVRDELNRAAANRAKRPASGAKWEPKVDPIAVIASVALFLRSAVITPGSQFVRDVAGVGQIIERLESMFPVAHGIEARGERPPARSDAYCAIDAEREYQDRKWGGREHDDEHTVADWMRYVIEHAGTARFAKDPDTRLHEVRKVAALAVACMESEGVRYREQPASAPRVEAKPAPSAPSQDAKGVGEPRA